MESANVQVLRKMEELFNGRDLDAYLELMDPEVEWHVGEEDPDRTVHHGRAAVRGYLDEWIDSLADLRIHIEEAKDLGDRVRTVIRFTGHGTASGATLHDRIIFVWSFKDGKVRRADDLGRDQAV